MKKRDIVGFGLLAIFLAVSISFLIPFGQYELRTVSAARKRTACLHNLQKIDVAQTQWEKDHLGVSPASPSLENLVEVGLLPKIPECPSCGLYELGTKGSKPTCTYRAHVRSSFGDMNMSHRLP